MRIEIRLKALLKDYDMDRFGIITQIARDLNLNRHTVTKLYQNRLSNPSLEVLGRMCEWLIEAGVPRGALPQRLFGCQPSKLWNAAIELGGVKFYCGEYQQEEARSKSRPPLAQRWISLYDADAANRIIQFLSSFDEGDGHPLHFHTEYIPFRAVEPLSELDVDLFEEDTRKAERTFVRLAEEKRRSARILIGSQRVNALLEFFVADLFGCKPFERTASPKVPFYQVYRKDDRKVPSCFGGEEPPPGSKEEARPGIWYWDADKSGKRAQWKAWPCVDGQEDAGIVVTVYDPGTAALDLAFFGFSARATGEIGRRLVDQPWAFWKPPVLSKKNQLVEVYVCRFNFACAAHAGRRRRTEKEFECIRLSEHGDLGKFIG